MGPYVEIGLEHAAAEGEARVRLLLARSMWIFAFRREGFDEAEADAARRAGEEAFALAEALGRDDLASAALDGVQSIEFIVGLHGLTWAVVERRLAIVERLTDPWEVGDALQTAADTALAVGRYEDARRWASEGFERARGGPDVWRAGLAWRAIARFKLGDWDGALEDYERMEAARAATRFGTTGYFTLTMWSCIALLHELRGERAAADRLVARVEAEIDGGTPTVRVIPFLARLSAHRGSDDAFARIESSASIVGREMGLGLILEAQCDVTAELGRFELADDTLDESRAFAARARLEALPLHADRLQGRAALAREELGDAARLLTSAKVGFAAHGARWEAAVAQLWLGKAQLAAGEADAASRSTTEALGIFDELRSVRERELARSLLDRAG